MLSLTARNWTVYFEDSEKSVAVGNVLRLQLERSVARSVSLDVQHRPLSFLSPPVQKSVSWVFEISDCASLQKPVAHIFSLDVEMLCTETRMRTTTGNIAAEFLP